MKENIFCCNKNDIVEYLIDFYIYMRLYFVSIILCKWNF